MTVLGAKRTSIVIGWALAALVTAAASAPSADADSMLVQPDGKIVVVGRIGPSFAALARLEPDGAPDPSFGQGGFVVDRRMPPLKALALEPDGRLLAAGVEGFQLARYLPDGTPDPTFGEGDVAGTADAQQTNFIYGDYGPETILLQPGGGILVGGTQALGRWNAPTAIVQLYRPNGTFVETAGTVPQPGDQATFESHLRGLVPDPDGSVIGVGWTYVFSGLKGDSDLLLARFAPGSGADYDQAFGAGRGLVRQAFPSGEFDPIGGHAIAWDQNRLLVAGTTDATFLLARFDGQGNLDRSFASGGFTSPPIRGSSGDEGDSWADAIAVRGDGRILLAGGTSRWGRWGSGVAHAIACVERCVQPMLAGFTAEGELDPGFGKGGLLRLLDPNGKPIEGEIEQIVRLPDGKILAKGVLTSDSVTRPFVARLNDDGTYDPGFGDNGLVEPPFPCSGDDARVRREECIPSARVRLEVRRVATGHPRLSLRVSSNLSWAKIQRVRVHLPKALRPSSKLAARAHVVGIGAEGTQRLAAPDPVVLKYGQLDFRGLGLPQALDATLSSGALRAVGKPSKRAMRFDVTVKFVSGDPVRPAGVQTVVLRRRGS